MIALTEMSVFNDIYLCHQFLSILYRSIGPNIVFRMVTSIWCEESRENEKNVLYCGFYREWSYEVVTKYINTFCLLRGIETFMMLNNDIRDRTTSQFIERH